VKRMIVMIKSKMQKAKKETEESLSLTAILKIKMIMLNNLSR